MKRKHYTTYIPRTLIEADKNVLNKNCECLLSECDILSNRQEHVYNQLYNTSNYTHINQQEEELFKLLEKTMTSQCNNACLLMGYRGSDKTATLKRTLKKLKEKYIKEGKSFIEVYINGFMQGDDTSAMREICRQMRLENDLELDKSRTSGSSSFAAYLAFLTDVLNNAKKAGVAVFFVLDEFDLFAQRPKQTLLYNLSDLLQSQISQIALIGLTTRLDAYRLLEKRIRSRITYRRIIFTHPKTLDELIHIIMKPLKLKDCSIHQQFIDKHNHSINKIDWKKVLNLPYQLGQSVRWFYTLLASAFAQLNSKTPYLTDVIIKKVISHALYDWKFHTVKTQSTIIEMCMISSMIQLEQKELVPYNFALIYDEYVRFQKTLHDHSVDLYPKNICLAAYKHLHAMGIIRFLERNIHIASGTNKQRITNRSLLDTNGSELPDALYTTLLYRTCRLTLPYQDLKEMFNDKNNNLNCPTWLRRWAGKWLK